jgi:tRNA U54 and U55 pseudouridine synthase Pus10
MNNFLTQPWCRYVIGNYIKLCRRTCQTRWLGTEGIKQISQNVEELVSQPLLALTCARQFSFHGMGREDVDVRMYICFRRVCLCSHL